MFWLGTGVLMVVMARVAAKDGGRAGLWFAVLASMLLMPTWITWRFGSLTMDFRAVGQVLGLMSLALAWSGPYPPSAERPRRRLLLADLMILVLFLVQVYTQRRIGRFGPLTAPDIARRWVLPYVAGRVFLGSADDVARVLPVASKLLMGLATFAVVEAVTKVHLVNRLLGKNFALLEGGEGYRWGLKRAQGPLDHPIFFGMMLVLLWPWVDEAARRAWRGRGEKWWLALAGMMAAAVVVTVSRGAQISLVGTVGVTAFFRMPQYRLRMFVAAVVLGGGGYVAKHELSEVLSKWAGEKAEEVRIVEINGNEYEYSGTNHRVLLFKAYEQAMVDTGAFGFGYEMLGIELEEAVAQRFSSIDDHYIRFLLQYGYVGLGAFVLLSLVSLIDLARVAWDVRQEVSGLAAAQFGGFAMVTVGLLSVWFSPDFGAVWLFSAGLAGNLRCLPPSEAPAAPEPPTDSDADEPEEPAGFAPPPLRPRIVPAHPPYRTPTPTPTQRQGPL
ncbi:MAG: hypothetical protein U0835_21810 [Isosphaeraceae bacterium]